MVMPAKFSTLLGLNTQATLHYGTNVDPARIIISKHTGFKTSIEKIHLVYVKNLQANKPASMKISLVAYYSGEAYPTILYQANYINYSCF